MTRNWQIYYNAIFGAIGGLVGWLVIGQFGTSEWQSITLAYIVVGAGVGLCIGAATGAVEGVIVKQSAARAGLGAALGGGAGLVGGMIGLLIGQGAFLLFEGGLLGRSTGWTALGLFLGIGEGLVSGKLKRASYGAVGGLAAGFTGGIIYEGATQLFLDQSDTAQMIVGAIGLIIIGASLGGIIPFSVDLIAKVSANHGLIRVLNGRRANLEIPVIDQITLGSYDGCDLYLPDKNMEGKQAQIGKGAQGFELKNIGRERPIAVNNNPLFPGQISPLTSGTQIQVGETALLFTVG
jgi:hypothetical protein